MRRIALLTFAALSIAACSNDATAPDTADITLDEGAFGTALTLSGGYEAGLYQDRLINGLPDAIKLSDDQKAKIRALVEAFEASTKADREALAAIIREAREAIKDKKGREEVQEILKEGAPMRDRLAAAERKLIADIDALLTAEQRAWILAHKPKKCRADKFPPLSDEQKAEIRALERTFRDQYKADMDSLKQIFEEAREAGEAGKSRAEVLAIIARGAPIAERLATARKKLHEDILEVLTPEQTASRCFPLG